MPGRDGTGNPGRGAGQGLGRGRGRGLSGGGRGPLGSNDCTCPNCGHQEPHAQRGVPCVQIKCPKCGTMMKGEFCQ